MKKTDRESPGWGLCNRVILQHTLYVFGFLGRVTACIDAYQLWWDRLNQLSNNNACLSYPCTCAAVNSSSGLPLVNLLAASFPCGTSQKQPRTFNWSLHRESMTQSSGVPLRRTWLKVPGLWIGPQTLKAR
jgi:hypothetical protein